MRPSIMSEGATTSAPALACATASAARIFSVGSLSTYSPLRTPQWPWSVYSQRQTSVMTTVFGLASLIALTARQTGPFGSALEVPTASLVSGMPKRITDLTPRPKSSRASLAVRSGDVRSMPGIDGTGCRTPLPGTTKRGAMKSDGARVVSRTISRSESVRRRRR